MMYSVLVGNYIGILVWFYCQTQLNEQNMTIVFSKGIVFHAFRKELFIGLTKPTWFTESKYSLNL
jgi:hypothetical protein